MILERGTLLNNRYRIVEILGQGGMGSVYRAVDENLGVEVAVKDNLFTTEEYARQFRREAIILANLRHPNLPRVMDHFVINGQGQYLVMDYIEGEDLRQRMERIGVVPEEEVITIGAAVCDALAYLASRKPSIIHRDIKPGNIKITPQGHIFLVDFGLAKTLHGSQATTTGARAMTPGYSPPEQYGTARTDHRSDIFSLGATLYAALTGATPEDALARAMDQAELTSIRKHNQRISRRLTTAIEKSLEVRPDDRYQTPEEFKQALLGASTSSKRREGDYYVAPPPVDEKGIPEDEAPAAAPESEKVQLPSEKNAQSILPISTPLEELDLSLPRSRPVKRRKGIGCWTVFLLVALLLVGGGIGVYNYDPELPERAMAQFWPMIFSPMATPTSALVAVEASFTPTLTQIPFTSTPQATATDTPEPTITLTPTETLIPTETPTSVPTPLGGSGQIAFASDITGVPQVYVINSIDGSGLRQITDMPEGACQPSWSPDLLRIVFISPCDTNRDYYPLSALYLINLDGTGLQPLPKLSGGDYDPDWSPDGKHIAFTSLRNSGRPQIYVLNLEDNSAKLLSGKFSTDSQPSWSPDGKQLIYVSTGSGSQQIWVMDADGGNPSQFSYSTNLVDSRPTWSPDQQTVLFTQLVKLGGIPWVSFAPYQVTGEYEEYRLGQGSLPMREAVFSPDGLWIVFEAWTAKTGHDIYISSASGAGLRQVTSGPAFDFDPAWSPLP
ncbi:MAG: protein kinase [Chloroflexota bacterium]